MADGQYECIDKKLIHRGAIIDYYQKTMSLPNGKTEIWDAVEHVGAAAVLAVMDDGRLLMVRQYREPLGRELLEIPAGKLDCKGEPFEQAAAREMSEETGYDAGRIEHLLTFYPTVAYSNERIEIYAAFDLKKGQQHLDDDEELNVETWKISDLVKMIRDGEIVDGKTIAAVMTYAAVYLHGEY